MGKKQEWSLPQLAESYSSATLITIRPDATLKPYVKYDQKSNTITFSEDESIAKFASKMFFIEIFLSNKKGDTNRYKQKVFLRKEVVEEQTKESPIQEELNTDAISAGVTDN